MDLFPKSNKGIFRKRIVFKESETDILVRENQWNLEQWERAKQHKTDNEAALEREMAVTMEQMSSFLHRLELAALVHSKTRPKDWVRFQMRDKYFNDQVQLGHALMSKVKELLDLEDTGIYIRKSYQSCKSFGEDQQESEGNMSQCSRYSSEIKDVLRKFNHVINVKNFTLPYQLKEHEIINDEIPTISSETTKDSLQFLLKRLEIDNIQPIFKSQPMKPSDSCCTVMCTVFGISVEGKASEKMAAKKDAALKMLERLLEMNENKKLPAQITPLNDKEVREAVAIVCEMQPYDEMLNAICEERRRQPPDFQTERHRVTCTALGLIGSAIYRNPDVARRAAARQILLQVKYSKY